jgi:hypothetical protein
MSSVTKSINNWIGSSLKEFFSNVPTSEWGSPLVIPKPDYKIGVSERLVNANYPTRRIDDILNSLKNSKYLSPRIT